MSQQQLSRTRPVDDGAEVLPATADDTAARLAVTARVVGAARAELCQRHHLSLRAVARRAGLDLREVAQQVGSGDELVRRVFFEVAVDAHDSMAAVAPASATSSCRDRLLAYARGYRHWALTHPGDFALLLGPASRALTTGTDAARSLAWFHGPLLDILSDGLRRGQVDVDPGAASRRPQPELRPGLLAAAQDLDPRLALAFVTLTAGMHGHLLLEGCGQLGAVFVDLDRAFEAQMRSLADAAGIA